MQGGPILHYWFTFLGDTRCGGILEGNNGQDNDSEYTLVVEDSDSEFYPRNGTSEELAARLNALQQAEVDN